MKKLLSIMLGLTLVMGAVSVSFAQEEKKEEMKKKGKKKGKKKDGESKPPASN